MKAIRGRRPLLCTAVLTGLAAVMSLWGQGEPAASKQPPSASPQKKEEPFIVQKKDISDVILITGELQAAQSREITTPRIRSGFASAITFLPLEGT
jgi:hypothetical protein